MRDALSKLNMPPELRKALREALARLVELAKPEVVILFGSWAEGRARPDSDVDLVVVARTNNRWHLARRLYLQWHESMTEFRDLPSADLLVYTPGQFDDALLVGFPAYQAVRHGVVVYGRIPAVAEWVAA
ncbi:MAG: nucleotidyltransferase domain-containing protein [candidate division WS1 bacterium]|jgi:predicted nucleotidyltransferase|nr:nucleotidyltransferase domain-containing protein [candidate division WS1 bacterium]